MCVCVCVCICVCVSAALQFYDFVSIDIFVFPLLDVLTVKQPLEPPWLDLGLLEPSVRFMVPVPLILST